ncbi:MAG: FG-GAP-like repeat-containing protein [Chitinophagaceae bacterium]
MKGRPTWVILFVISAVISCKQKQEDTLFHLLTDSGIEFENKVVDGKKENSFLFRNFYNGGGVAIADINNDGLSDVFLTSNTGENKLYLNKGNLKFEDIALEAGITPDDKWYTGVVFADLNSDGWLDIYVCSSGHMGTANRKNKLYINNHDLTFTESAEKFGLAISAYTTQVSFFDYDLDGDLDCFMINNSPIPVNQLNFSFSRDLPEKDWPVGEFLKGGGDHLYRNDKGQFIEVTKEAGLHGGLISLGLGVSVGDINRDGYPDVYVANDSYERDYLYVNQKNGTFKDDFEQCIQHTSMSSMGADIADINNDGYPDIFTTDMLPEDDYRLKTLGAFDNIDLYRGKVKAGFFHQFMQNCLQVNNKKGRFLETAYFSGVAATDWSWGALMFDADNDGLNDIYVCNGVNRDVTNLDFMDFFANDVIQKMILAGKKENMEEVLKEIPVTPMPNKAFRNMGHLQFADAGNLWGLSQKTFSNGAAYGDLDNDGDIDLVVNNENQPAFVYKNNARELNKNNYVSVLLQGKGENSFAVGSTITLYVGDQVLSREVIPSRGFQSSVDYKVVIGLGSAAQVDSMIISWPDRSFSKYEHPEINKLYILAEEDEKKADMAVQPTKAAPFTLLDTVVMNVEKHQEDDYVDFYYERNIPAMLSREGPKAVKGDVNGDGREDIYIGGAKGQGGQLYLQSRNGAFVKKEQQAFEEYRDFEDVAELMFDCDNDGDLDLLLCPGGNFALPNTREIQLRLFRNDGDGNFDIEPTAFSNNEANISVAIANDFDRDGDLDLFVGGRSVPRNYGLSPRSYLFVNNGKGRFTDMAKTKNPDIANIGMVTGAVWSDVAGDKNEELIIVGEWMSPRLFSFTGDRFSEIKSNLSDLKGWWQTITVADMNRDGKADLILGNIGENFYLRPDKRKAVRLWVNDFNQNGNVDKIITRQVEGKDKPVFLKHEMQDQVPSIKKGNLKHGEYAKKTIQELFLPALLNRSIVKEFNYTPSCMAYNNGNGNFTIQKLPTMVQLSSVNAAHCLDLNQDGYLDLVLGGNNFGFMPQLGKLDGSLGHVLINNGKGDLIWMEPGQSGLELTGAIRDILSIKKGNTTHLLFLRNNEYPALYSIKKPIVPVVVNINHKGRTK